MIKDSIEDVIRTSKLIMINESMIDLYNLLDKLELKKKKLLKRVKRNENKKTAP